MKVKQLIELLQTYDQDLEVAYCKFSEQALLEPSDIVLLEACEPRPDGWIQDKRPDKQTRTYVLFPGN